MGLIHRIKSKVRGWVSTPIQTKKGERPGGNRHGRKKTRPVFFQDKEKAGTKQAKAGKKTGSGRSAVSRPQLKALRSLGSRIRDGEPVRKIEVINVINAKLIESSTIGKDVSTLKYLKDELTDSLKYPADEVIVPLRLAESFLLKENASQRLRRVGDKIERIRTEIVSLPIEDARFILKSNEEFLSEVLSLKGKQKKEKLQGLKATEAYLNASLKKTGDMLKALRERAKIQNAKSFSFPRKFIEKHVKILE